MKALVLTRELFETGATRVFISFSSHCMIPGRNGAYSK